MKTTAKLKSLWMRSILGLTAILFFPSAPLRAQSFDPATLRPAGYHLDGVAYWSTPYFANALHGGHGWLGYYGTEWGSPLDIRSAQFDSRGFPRYLLSGQKLRAVVTGLHMNYDQRPATWPVRDGLLRGKVVVAWRGQADVRLNTGSFVASESSGAATGLLTDGRRTYLLTGSQAPGWIDVLAVASPLTDLAVWLPHPDDPATTVRENETSSLEGHLFHPWLLRRIAESDWAFLRFMGWSETNASPEQDWLDRRPPGHAFMNGVINRRAPASGFAGDRNTGVAWEHAVALGNAAGRDIWITIPHLATDDTIARLARLIRFGSDGTSPYSVPVSDPVYPPLRSDLRVFLEFSNEIWSEGNSFPQGNWAQSQADALGISKARFNARQFCRVWRIFQEVFGDTTRLVRVAAVWTGLESYTRDFLGELGRHGPTLNPPVRPDVLALTTYFGNGMQDWVHQRGWTAGKLFNDPYWTSPTHAEHLETALREWTRRLLSGDAAQGGGFDQTGVGGGFSASFTQLGQEILGYPLPLIAYEGGPSIYTDYLDGGAVNASGIPTDDHVTTFMESLNRQPGMRTVYDIHLNMARSKGLWTHTPFVDTSSWGKFGQWGHLEYLDQPNAAAPKWQAVVDWNGQTAALRHPARPAGTVPRFVTEPTLPAAEIGQPYSQDIVVAGGEGARVLGVVGAALGAGLQVEAVPGDPDRIRVRGSLTETTKNHLYLRVTDGDGDPAWRIFSFDAVGGPGTLVQSDFTGVSPALHRPWTHTFVLSPSVAFSGWDIGRAAGGGSGVRADAGDNGFVHSVDAPGSADEPLSQALAEDEYLKCTLTPIAGPLDLRGAEVRFRTRRIDWHSPRSHALFSSLAGFHEAAALGVTAPVDKDDTDEHEHVFRLPSTSAYASVSGPVEFRLYAALAQWGGHRTSLTAFKLTATAPSSSNEPPVITQQPASVLVSAGQPASFSVVATDAGPLTYQWYRSGAPISGATAATFSIPSVKTTDAGTYTVAVTDSGGLSVTSAPAILSLDLVPAVTTTSLPAGRLRQPYSFSLQASGGNPPLTWKLASGSLPSGLTLSSSGVISGIPKTAVTRTFTIRVTDSDGDRASRTLRLTITRS